MIRLAIFGLTTMMVATLVGQDERLPEFTEGTRLVFLGDSITDMKWGRNEADRNHYLGHSFVYLIAARLGAEMPQAKLEFFNRGKSGNRVSQLRERWQKDAIEMKPDVLTILIGVNDVARDGGELDLAEWEADYRYLLETSRAANPDLRIVLLQPFVLRVTRLDNDAAWAHWRGTTDRMGKVVARLADEFGATLVRTQEVFDKAAEQAPPSHWIWDGVHPLPQGHELIARAWLQALSRRYSCLSPVTPN